MVANGYDPVMDVVIRRASEADAAATAALLNPIIAAGCYTMMTTAATEASQRAWMQSLDARAIAFVAESKDSGSIVGMQSVEPIDRTHPAMNHVGDISTFVALDCARQGVGRTLMNATLIAARENGFRKLLAMIRSDNPGAQAFYRAHGFEPAGVLREHVRLRGCFVDEVLHERLLG